MTNDKDIEQLHIAWLNAQKRLAGFSSAVVDERLQALRRRHAEVERGRQLFSLNGGEPDATRATLELVAIERQIREIEATRSGQESQRNEAKQEVAQAQLRLRHHLTAHHRERLEAVVADVVKAFRPVLASIDGLESARLADVKQYGASPDPLENELLAPLNATLAALGQPAHVTPAAKIERAQQQQAKAAYKAREAEAQRLRDIPRLEKARSKASGAQRTAIEKLLQEARTQ